MGTKVKLELRQPKIKCSGRDSVSCYYKGKILKEEDDAYLIEFKYKGEVMVEWYNKNFGFEEHHLLKDIKIKL